MQSSNIYALVLRLTAGGLMRLSVDSGRLVHAAFFDVLRQLDAPLATRLHDTNQRKLYTVSPLWGDHHSVQPGDHVFVRFALLDPALAHLLVEAFLLKGRQHRLKIGPAWFAITDVYITPEGHPRAGTFPLTLPEIPDFYRVGVTFLTSTAFSRKRGKQVQYETGMAPRDVWKSARRMWESAGGHDPGPDFDDWCVQHTMVENRKLCTQRVDFGHFFVPGVVGEVIYQLTGDHLTEYHQWWCHFARFLPFSSVGYKTTMGLGQVSIVIDQ
jgi:CRISPR-associated endoribonuclease Cas6